MNKQVLRLKFQHIFIFGWANPLKYNMYLKQYFRSWVGGQMAIKMGIYGSDVCLWTCEGEQVLIVLTYD